MIPTRAGRPEAAGRYARPMRPGNCRVNHCGLLLSRRWARVMLPDPSLQLGGKNDAKLTSDDYAHVRLHVPLERTQAHSESRLPP
jgi:hypothetical protein